MHEISGADCGIDEVRGGVASSERKSEERKRNERVRILLFLRLTFECHSWAYVEFVVNGSDYASWHKFSMASRAYIHRRNRDRHDPRILELENRRKVA